MNTDFFPLPPGKSLLQKSVADPQAGQPPWLLLDDVTLTTVSECLDTPAHW